MTLPKLRFPSLAGFLALFFVPTDVTKIVSGINGQIAALEAAVAHHMAVAAGHHDASEALFAHAALTRDRAYDAEEDAEHAGRVAAKLAALVR